MTAKSWKRMFAASAALAFSIASAYATTYYHKGSDGYGASTFNAAKAGSVGWSTSPNGSIVSSISDWEESDFIVSGSGNAIRIPATDADVTFPGKSLTFNDSTLSFKRASGSTALTRNVTIDDLRFTGTGGIFSHGESKNDHGSNPTVFCVKGGITIADGAAMTLDQSFNSNNDKREFVIDSAVTGGEDSSIAFKISGSGSNNTAPATFNSLSGFYGTFKVASGSGSFPFYLTVNGTFNGTVTSLPANTQSATFDFDGLPAGKGIRIKGTAPAAAVMPKLRVYSATADFTTPGLVVATFEDISSPGAVENIGWSIQYATSVDGTYSGLTLKAVANGDGTVSLVTAANVYYKTGSDSSYSSTLPMASRLASGWSLRPGGGTHAVEAANIASGDFIVSGGNVLRTVNDQTFGGNSLKISGPGDGSSWQVIMKHSQEGSASSPDTALSSTITVGNLVFSGGVVFLGSNNLWFKLAGNIGIESGRSFGIMPVNNENSYALRRLEVASSVTGGADASIDVFKTAGGSSKATAGAFHLVFDDLENFEGVFNDSLPVSNWVADGSYIHFKGAFGGRIGTMNATAAKFIVNYDGLPAGKGLVSATTTVPEKLKSGTVFYSSDVSKFTTDGTVLATFPAGTTIDPAQFSFKYASAWNGEESVTPPCRVESGANGEVLLVVDIQAPAFAKMVADAESGEYSWHFYLAAAGGALGDDVTETCGKTVPDNSMTVLFSSAEEFAAISANPGSAKEYRITSFVCTGDTDFTAAPFTVTPDSGLSIDPAGHRVTVSAALANAIAGVSSATAGSEFCVNVASGAETLDGPAISGTVKLVKTGAGMLYCAKANQTYTGGNTVEAGILAAPYPASETHDIPSGSINRGEKAVNADTATYTASLQYFGATNTEIKVESGAGFDLNSNYGYNKYNIVLNGGTLWNTQYSLSRGIHQRDITDDGVTFSMTADSSLRFRSDILVSGGNPIDLGGHTLSIYCALGSKYIHLKNSITNGTVQIVKGDAAYGKTPDTGSGIRIAAAVDAANGFTLEDGTGLLVANAFTVSNYTAKLPERYGTLLYTGSAQMTVTGTFRPEQRYFPGITMADGSTLDLGAWDIDNWGAFKPLATGARNGGKIDFADGAKVTIDLSGRADTRALAMADDGAGTYLFNWGEGAVAPAAGAGVEFSLDPENEGRGFELAGDATGLKIRVKPGFTIRIAGGRDVKVSGEWMAANCGDFGTVATGELSGWLEAAGANGLPRWQSWLLGLDPAKEDSVMLCSACEREPAEGGEFTVDTNLNIPEEAETTVTARLVRDGNQVCDTKSVSSGKVWLTGSLAEGSSFGRFTVRVTVE